MKFFATLTAGVAFGFAMASFVEGPHQLWFAWGSIYESVLAAGFFFWPFGK